MNDSHSEASDDPTKSTAVNPSPNTLPSPPTNSIAAPPTTPSHTPPTTTVPPTPTTNHPLPSEPNPLPIATTPPSPVAKIGDPLSSPTPPSDPLTQLGHLANHHARQHLFHKYMSTKSENTLRRHHYDLRLFAEYLHDLGLTVDRTADLQHNPTAWTGVTWGLIETFLNWQLAQGYAITSANARLSTIKNYARLAVKADIIPRDEAPLLETIRGYSRKEGINLDEKRPVTRIGHKKSATGHHHPHPS